MSKRKQQAARTRELPEIELRPDGEKRADELLRRMLATPPDPFTPKPKKSRKRAK
jgi:hypothetical protein